MLDHYPTDTDLETALLATRVVHTDTTVVVVVEGGSTSRVRRSCSASSSRCSRAPCTSSPSTWPR